MKNAISTMMKIAQTMALNSTCSRLAVGCVITDFKDIILSTGYNGVPSGVMHCEDEDKVHKPGHCPCLHAEQNAITHCIGLDYRIPKKVYITHSPCLSCTKLLIAAGVKEIYYHKAYRGLEETQQFANEMIATRCSLDRFEQV